MHVKNQRNEVWYEEADRQTDKFIDKEDRTEFEGSEQGLDSKGVHIRVKYKSRHTSW